METSATSNQVSSAGTRKFKRASWPGLSLSIIGVLVCSLGIFSLVMNYIQYFTQSQLPLQYITTRDGAALGFVLVGAALVAAGQRWQRLLTILAYIIIVIFICSLVNVSVILPLHLAEIIAMMSSLMLPPVMLHANIALAFLISGIALLVIAKISLRGQTSMMLGILGSIIVALGLISFFGSNNNILSLYGWSHLFQTEFSTALGIILLGIGFIACAWHRAIVDERIAIRLLPVLIITVVILLTLLLWQGLISQRNSNIRRMVQLEASTVRNEVASRMHSRVYSLQRMAQRWEIRGGTPKKEWQADASAHVQHHQGYEAVEWIDKGFRIRWVVPEKGNEELINKIAKFERRRGEAIINARQRGKVTLTRAINLIQGGKGFIIYVPLYLAPNKFDGFLIAVVRFKPLLDAILGAGIAPGYHLAIFDGQNLIYQRGQGDPRIRRNWSASADVDLYGTRWRVEVWPTAGLLELERSVLPSVTLIMGLLMALLLGLSIRYAQIAQVRAKQLVVSNRDLTREIGSRERAEKAKSEMEKVLLQNQKLQAIGTLAGGIAHDFNNILYSIIGYVDMAKEDAPKESVTRRNLGKVLEVSHRGQKLVNQILSFSRQQSYEFATTSLREVMEDTLTLIMPSLPMNIMLETYLYEGNDNVHANATQLEQVFVNLINNAVDAIGSEEGKITIRLSRRTNDSRLMESHPKLTAASYFLMEFQDTGHGIDDETISRIFEPFYTTKEVNKGTGLGMSIAHGIIDDHNGIILVESTLDVGTIFYIYLPELESE